MRTLITLVFFLFAVLATSVKAENPSNSQQMVSSHSSSSSRADRKDANSTLREGIEVYRAIVKGSHGAIPRSVQANAKCAMVFPNVITAALAVGGIHGDGVAFCKNASQEWSNPVFVDLTGASLGVQAGVKSADVVLFMTGENARTAIERGSFQLGGELSAVAGKFDETFSAPTAGVVAYTRTEGVFAGASLGGVNISRDQEDEKAVYGASGASANLFERKVPASMEQNVSELKKLLPEA